MGEPMEAIILAGGFARRLGPLGDIFPKPMLVVEGDTLIGHLVRKLRAEGIEPVITVNKRFEDFFREFPRVVVERATREEEKPGALSGLSNAISEMGIDDDVMVLCADNYFSSDLGEFISSFTGETLVGVYYASQNPDLRPEEMATVRFEGCERYPPPSRSFRITDFREKVSPPLSQYVGTGIYILPKRVLPVLREFCSGGRRDAPGYFIQHLLERGETVKGFLLTGDWYDISHRSYVRIFREGEIVERSDKLVKVERRMGDLLLNLVILRAGGNLTPRRAEHAAVYFVLDGIGEVEVDGRRQMIRSRDIIPVLPGSTFGASNMSDRDMLMVAVTVT
jgi:NDP-sugar pyrophosphorylase family protein/quercetin dioxygenase-like cupin family protein